MTDFCDPFLTFLETDPDANASDDRHFVERLAARQDAIERWLMGLTESEEVLDTLHDQGANPDAYVDSVCTEINFLIDSVRRWRTDESGLLLPEGAWSG